MFYVTIHDVHISPAQASYLHASQWIGYKTQSDGMISYLSPHGQMRINPHELTIVQEEDDTMDLPVNPAIGNLSSHPRCTTCGCGTWQTIAIYQDHFVLEFDCTHERQAYEHDGTKIENCRFCAGSGVCKPVWSHEDITCPCCDDKYK